MTDDERTLLGAILVSPRTLDSVADILRAEHFADERHAVVYRAMVSLLEQGESIDTGTLLKELKARKLLNVAGGMVYIGSLLDGVPQIGNAHGLAVRVREASRRRHVVRLGEKLAEMARDDGQETDDILDRHQTALNKLMDAGDVHTQRIGSLLKEAHAKIEQLVASPQGVSGVPTGIPDLDKLTGGWQKGTLNIVAARPARGKSVLCGQVAIHASTRDLKVLMFTLEMPPVSVVRRIILSEAGVDRWDLRTHADRWGDISSAMARLQPLPLWFNGWECPTLIQIRSACRKLQAVEGLDLVVVDYLQRCSVDRNQERWRAVGDLARGLKSLAMSLNVPVLCAAQLNREAQTGKPTLANLREAGDIEQEADIVAFLHPVTSMEEDSPEVDLIVEKHREGAQSVIPLRFDKNVTRFVNLVREGR